MQVLGVIQNFETLANEAARTAEIGPESPREAKAVPQAPPAGGESENSPQTRRAPLNKAMRQVHLPPVAAQISTFHQKGAPAGDEDDEGIRYVDKLQVGTARPRPSGSALVGKARQAKRWSREKHRRDEAKRKRINVP